eukprot:GHVU01007142.1.p1 GENE.GHVU01007142.1~~GHVU01007142.1.p1  ORF type:complete len:160 (+),score=7.02 GHVU01007142.1:845-1324(+)
MAATHDADRIIGFVGAASLQASGAMPDAIIRQVGLHCGGVRGTISVSPRERASVESVNPDATGSVRQQMQQCSHLYDRCSRSSERHTQQTLRRAVDDATVPMHTYARLCAMDPCGGAVPGRAAFQGKSRASFRANFFSAFRSCKPKPFTPNLSRRTKQQ